MTVTHLSRLADRFVVVLPGDALYSPDGPVLAGDPDWDPELFRTESDALLQLDRCAEEAENLGLVGWAGRVCRLSDLGANPGPALPAQDRPDPAMLNATYPAPAPVTRQEFAVLAGGGPHREFDPARDDNGPFRVFADLDSAQDRATDITEDRAPRLGVTGHPVIVVSRTITTTTGPWELAS